MNELEAELLRALPDVPRWIEGRALVLSGAKRILRDARGFAIQSQAPGGQVVVLAGRPGSELVRAALSDREDRQLICMPEDEERVAAMLTEWRGERALLHQLADPGRLAPEDPRVRVLAKGDALAELPRELREELLRFAAGREVHAAFEDGRAASFAYAFWRTEGQFDLSIDTAEGHRRRGLARAAASALIRAEARAGRRPVWGAMESNHASRRLAASLGFEEVDRVVLFVRA